jgi:hypothetical protein
MPFGALTHTLTFRSWPDFCALIIMIGALIELHQKAINPPSILKRGGFSDAHRSNSFWENGQYFVWEEDRFEGW